MDPFYSKEYCRIIYCNLQDSNTSFRNQWEEDTPTVHVNNPRMDGTSLFNSGKIKDIEKKIVQTLIVENRTKTLKYYHNLFQLIFPVVVVAN